MTIYIGNLSFQAEQEDLLDLFSQYGEVKSASLPLDPFLNPCLTGVYPITRLTGGAI